MREHERPRDRRERLGVWNVGKAVDVNRAPEAYRKTEFLLGERVKALESGSAAGKDDAGVKSVQKILVFKLAADYGKEFLESQVHDRIQSASGNGSRFHERRRAGKRDASGGGACREKHGGSLFLLKLFRLGVGRLERVCDIARYVVASDADGVCGGEIAVEINGVAGRAAAQIENQGSVAFFGVVQYGVGRA